MSVKARLSHEGIDHSGINRYVTWSAERPRTGSRSEIASYYESSARTDTKVLWTFHCPEAHPLC